MIPTKFQLILPNGFRQDFSKLANHKQELPMVAILAVWSARDVKIFYKISQTSFLQSNKQFIVPPSFSELETRIAHGDYVFCPISIEWGNLIEELL